MEKSLQFDGSTDVNKFITKVELIASLKNHTEDKKALFIGSKLNGPALDVYKAVCRWSEGPCKNNRSIAKRV